MNREVSWALLMVSVAVTGVFIVFMMRAARLYAHTWDHRRVDRHPFLVAERALIAMSVLVVIGVANVVTGFGFVLNDEAVRQVGAIAVRGALVTAALYLLVRRPYS